MNPNTLEVSLQAAVPGWMPFGCYLNFIKKIRAPLRRDVLPNYSLPPPPVGSIFYGFP